jgi:hypothetical protein
MKNEIVMVLAGAGMAAFAATVSATESTQVQKVQGALDAWFAARGPIEKVTGIAAYISFGLVPSTRRIAGTRARMIAANSRTKRTPGGGIQMRGCRR